MRGLKPVVFIMMFTGVLNLFYTPGRARAVPGSGASPSPWRVCSTPFFMVLRIMLLIAGTFLLTYTTSPILLTDGLESLLGP